MIDGKNFFNQQIDRNLKTYKKIIKIATSQEDDYTTACLLDSYYFNNHYKMIPIDLSKQQVFDVDPRATQQINFTLNLDRARNATMFFIIEKPKDTILNFPQVIVKVL